MKNLAVVACAVLLMVATSGCYGPQKLTRQYDDWLNQSYVESPWLAGNIVAYALITTGFVVTYMVDALILNPIDFWGTSAWPFGKGVGTPFNHKTPALPKR